MSIGVGHEQVDDEADALPDEALTALLRERATFGNSTAIAPRIQAKGDSEGINPPYYFRQL